MMAGNAVGGKATINMDVPLHVEPGVVLRSSVICKNNVKYYEVLIYSKRKK